MYGILAHSASISLDCSSDWLQARFTAWELGAYLEGPIRTRQDTPELSTLPASFRGRLAVAALQKTFPGHYLTTTTAPPTITDAAPFQLTCPPPSALYPTLAHLQGGARNKESGSNDDTGDASALILTA